MQIDAPSTLIEQAHAANPALEAIISDFRDHGGNIAATALARGERYTDVAQKVLIGGALSKNDPRAEPYAPALQAAMGLKTSPVQTLSMDVRPYPDLNTIIDSANQTLNIVKNSFAQSMRDSELKANTKRAQREQLARFTAVGQVLDHSIKNGMPNKNPRGFGGILRNISGVIEEAGLRLHARAQTDSNTPSYTDLASAKDAFKTAALMSDYGLDLIRQRTPNTKDLEKE